MAAKTKQPIAKLGQDSDEKALFKAARVSESLLREIEQADNQHKDKSLSRKASASVLPFIAGLMQYGQALDVFANSNDLLCPIWGAIRIVLHLAKEFGEYFNRLSAMLKDFGDILNRIPRRLRLFPDNSVLQIAIISIYQDMFEFSQKAKNIFKVGREESHGLLAIKNAVGFAVALKNIWKPFDVEFGAIKARIAKNVTAIETEADVAEKELASQERRKDGVRWSKVEASQRLLVEFIDDQSMAKVNEWLSPANVATNHKAAETLRHGDSGTWFLQSETFRKWLNEENSFLWLNAIPGAGKTVLVSSIINYLREHFQDRTTGLAYFYCDYKDIQKQEPSKVLGTILAMFGKQNRAVFEAIENFFLQQYKDTSTFTAEFDKLLNNFGSLVNGHFDSAILVIDALDEAGIKNVDCLTHALKSLHQQCRSLKILVTSRNELPISRAFENLPRTSIGQGDVASDISKFITAELSAKTSQRKLKLREPGLELIIRDSLVDKSEGMFQMAKCQIEALCKLRNDKAIRAALLNLPKTLQETYMRILKRLEDDYPEDTATVRKILCWLVRGTRKPTLDELAEAIAVDPDSDDTYMDFDAVDNDPEDILEQLGALVTVSSDRAIALAHFSVKEFLVSDDLKNTKSNFWIGDSEVEAQLASVCLTYLCYEDFKRPQLPDAEAFGERLNKYKLFHYATEAWAIHAQRSELDGHQPKQVLDLTMRLLGSRRETQGNYDSWAECHQHYKYSKQFDRRKGDPLFVASFFGLTEASSALLQEEEVTMSDLASYFRAAATNGHAGVVKVFLEYSAANLESEDEHDTPEGGPNGGDDVAKDMPTTLRGLKPELPKALYAAAAKGHTSVISILLAHRSPINSHGGRDGTALQAAALEGRADTVKLLLEQGASHSEACKRYGTPLAAAAEKAHLRTFDVLLNHGADPNSRGGWYSLPLVSAIVGKNLSIIRRLVEVCDVNATGGRHGGPLPAAAAFGMNDLVKELVDQGAKVNDNDDKSSDALYAASLAGHASTVGLLLGLRADVNALGGRHQNALGAASSEGHLEVVEILLGADADVAFYEKRWGNALQVASQRGHDAVVSLLADAGMDPNTKGGDKGTALVGAAANGHDAVIKTLFDLGVPSGSVADMTSALVAAASSGYNSSIQLLASFGANVNGLNGPSKTADYCTPLQAAASRCNLEIVKLLISLGAKVNSVDEGWFGTALVAAVVANGLEKEMIIKILLDKDVNINGISPNSSHFYGPALLHAVSKGDMECATILLDKGADVNLQESAFISPLQMAARENRDGMVDLLLERGALLNIFAEPLDVRKDINSGLDRATITALQDAAWFGHEELVRKLVRLGADLSVNHKEAPFKSALQVAAYRGHVDTVKALIQLNSDVNERGGYFGSSLQAAACRGCFGVVGVLLEAGATANEIDVGHFHSALLSACMIDIDTNISIVKLLVEHGADVNQKQKGPYPYPLHATSKFLTHSANDPNVFLLKSGADPDAYGGLYGTALQAAAAQGGEVACKALLGLKSPYSKPANPNITGGFYNTPLQAAYRHGWYQVIGTLYQNGARNDLIGGSRAGSVMGQAIGLLKGLNDDGSLTGACQTLLHQLIVYHKFDLNLEYGRWGNAVQNLVMAGRDNDEVRMMLDTGADLNKVGGMMGTAIVAAAWRGDMEIFNELLDRGADVNLGNYRYPNAAFGAIQGVEKEILKLLIEKGVNIKETSANFGTTAQLAARKGLMGILRMVLRAGTEINTPDCGRYGSPLQAAACKGHDSMVRYLVHCGANIKAKGGWHGGVLNAAVMGCHETLIEFLLSRGADVNEPGRIYATPLQAAASEGRLSTVLVLLRYGADLNRSGGKYGTALQASCAGGRSKLVKLLVEKGAELNFVGGRYRTALQAAAIRGDETIMRYLLEEGATWSLVDRKHLGHIKPAVLDKADKLLRMVQEPTPTERGQRSETVEEKEEAVKDPLPWNIESIPNACEEYSLTRSNSRWAAVRELSFHSFSQRHLKHETANILGTEVRLFTAPKHVHSGFFSRANSSSSETSRVSVIRAQRGLSKSVSRTGTLDKQDENDPLNTWDESALSWVQL